MTSSAKQWEYVAAAVALAALVSCSVVLFSSCGGEDLVIGGTGLPTTTSTSEPADTPTP